MSAKLGSNPSYMCHSVLEAQILWKHGITYYIGNGQRVNILEEPWLLSYDPYVYSTNETLVNQIVSSLMVTGFQQWDRDLIVHVFEEREASLILSIPLNNDTEIPIIGAMRRWNVTQLKWLILLFRK